jgi:hypothetical protein
LVESGKIAKEKSKNKRWYANALTNNLESQMPLSEKNLEERKFIWENRRFFIAGIGAVILFLIGLWQFTITSRNEFAKPVLEKQMNLCIEASNAAAILAQPNPDLKGETAINYLALYYGKLAVVEDQCVYQTMVDFKTLVFDKKQKDGDNEPVTRKALKIAFACRRMLSKGWKVSLLGIYDPQHLFEAFTDLKDYKESMKSVASAEGTSPCT